MRYADTIGDPRVLLDRYRDVVQRRTIPEHVRNAVQLGQVLVRGLTNDQIYELTSKLDSDDVYWLNQWRMYITDFSVAIRGVLRWVHEPGTNLALALLQQYMLTPQQRREVEAASKFFAKTRINLPKAKSEIIPLWEKLLQTLNSFAVAAAAIIDAGKVRTESSEALRAGPFRIVDAGGYDEKTLGAAQVVISEAAGLLASHGLDQVCYGDVHLTKTISRQKVLAFYVIKNDEMFVRANLRGEESAAVSTILHELGHRYSHKFLKNQNKTTHDLYRNVARIARETVSSDRPPVGDILTVKGRSYKVVGVVPGRKGPIVQLVHADDPARRAKISLESYQALKGTVGSGFVSRYARTNPEENFAEMFSAYARDALTPAMVELFEQALINDELQA